MTTRWLKRFSHDCRGTAAVEFGFVAIPFILLLIGTIEYARFAWTRYAMQATVTAGARCVGVLQLECSSGGKYSAGATRSFLIERASKLAVRVSNDEIQINNATTCGGLDGFASVSMTYTFNSVVPQLIEPFSDLSITATSCFATQSR